MRKTKEQAQATKQSIFKAALKVFSRKGYAGTTLEDIAREAGVTRGAIYWHFDNKYHIYSQLVEDSYTQLRQLVGGMLKPNGSPLERIRRFMREFLVMLEQDQEYRAMEEIILYKTEMVQELQPLHSQYQEIIGTIHETLATLIQQGKEVGEIDPGVDPQAGAMVTLGLISGFEGILLTDGGFFSPARDADRFINIFFKGMMKRKD